MNIIIMNSWYIHIPTMLFCILEIQKTTYNTPIQNSKVHISKFKIQAMTSISLISLLLSFDPLECMFIWYKQNNKRIEKCCIIFTSNLNLQLLFYCHSKQEFTRTCISLAFYRFNNERYEKCIATIFHRSHHTLDMICVCTYHY